MHRRHLGSVLLAALLMLALTACGGKAPPPDPSADIPTLAQVRQLAESAMNTELPSNQRQQARIDAMTRLLALLRQPASASLSKSEWEQPVGANALPLIRYYDSGQTRVYTLTIPFSGVVPPGERVAVQYVPPSGPPVSTEVEVQPGGQLVGAMALDDSRGLTLAFSLARGGGYVMHLTRDARSGEFRPDPTPFQSLPTTVGGVRLELKGNALAVDLPADMQWNPQFDAKGQRFYMNADLGMVWKGKYSLLDERSYTAFEGFLKAANPATAKDERAEAWEKASRKLPEYLSQIESLRDDLTGKLPTGALLFEERGANLTVRVVSIPAPDFVGKPSFTVIQHRSGNGLPQAQVVELQGVAEAVRVVQRHGLPGVMILSGGKQQTISLLKSTTANAWEAAPDWYGFIPTDETVKLERTAADLKITGAKVTLEADGSARICATERCFTLNWVGGRLSGAGWIGARVTELMRQPSSTAVAAASDLIKQYLTSGDAGEASAAELTPVLGGSIGLWGLDLREGARAFVFPPNPTGPMPLILQSGSSVLVHTGGITGAVERWADVREVQGGSNRYILVLGRSADRAAVLLFQHTAEGWKPANALAQPAEKTVGEWTMLRYTPGQTAPVTGLYVVGRNDLRAEFAADGRTVQFCEADKQCTLYTYDQGWVLK